MNQATADAVVLGSGHNSLILACYLARAGLEVVCLETRDTAGGGLATIEWPAGSGFLHNTHSFYHRGLTQMPWYCDLGLERHGARYVQPPMNVALITESGRVLAWWDDMERTAASFAQFSRHDADAMRRWADAFRPIVETILQPEAQAPPLPPDERERKLAESRLGRLLLETSRLSPWEFVLREFEHPTVQAGLLFFNGLREVDLRLPGFGHHIPALLASGRMAQMCLGGSARLAEALVAALEEAGGRVVLGARPRRIVVEQGRATGVETVDGTHFAARRLVASGLNPQQTFLELIDEQFLPAAWRKMAAAYQYNLLAPLFALNVNLQEPPRYRAQNEVPELADALMIILGIERAERFQDIARHHEAGTISPTVMWGSCPTRFDPTQAPAGKHTAFFWEKLPYRLHGDARNWDAEAKGHAGAMLDLWSRYAPNVAEAVIDMRAATPLDTERTLENMRNGDLLVGSFAAGQVGYHRPFPGAGHYRGHLPGLYLCGSCCHPGGNITGLPGYNSAQVVLADLGISF